MQGGAASSSKGNMKGPARKFTSDAIVRRHDDTKIECASGFLIMIGRPLNVSRTRENGFPDEVCQRFRYSFPFGWDKIVNPSVEQRNGHANNQTDPMASPLRENGTKKCVETSVNLGTTDALQLPTEPETPQFEAVQSSEANTVRRLRSGKIFGMSSNSPLELSCKKQKESSTKMLPHKRTADVNSCKKGCSVLGTVAADELQSHDSHGKGDVRPTKRGRGRSKKVNY